jgi:hypothetical protein
LKNRELQHDKIKEFKPRHGSDDEDNDEDDIVDDDSSFSNLNHNDESGIGNSLDKQVDNDQPDQSDDAGDDDDEDLLKEYNEFLEEHESDDEDMEELSKTDSIDKYFDIYQPLYQEHIASTLSRMKSLSETEDLDDDAYIQQHLNSIGNKDAEELLSNVNFNAFSNEAFNASSTTSPIENVPIVKATSGKKLLIHRSKRIDRVQIQKTLNQYIAPKTEEKIGYDEDVQHLSQPVNNDDSDYISNYIYPIMEDVTAEDLDALMIKDIVTSTQMTFVSDLQRGGASQSYSLADLESDTPIKTSNHVDVSNESRSHILNSPHELDSASIEEVEKDGNNTAAKAVSDIGSLNIQDLSRSFTSICELTDTDQSNMPIYAKDFYEVGARLLDCLLYRWGVATSRFLKVGYDRPNEICFAPYRPHQSSSETSCIFNCFSAVINQHLLLSSRAYYYKSIPHPWKQ